MSDDIQNSLKNNQKTNQETPEECPHCKEYKLGWQRAQADYQNLQKETARQKADWLHIMKGDILESFVPIYDNFKKAFRTNHTNIVGDDTNMKQFDNWKRGIEYIMKQFGDVLKQNNIEEIKTVGEVFDPRFHEIVGEEEVEGIPEHQIVKEVEGGYISGGKVIKAAKVVVSKDNQEARS